MSSIVSRSLIAVGTVAALAAGPAYAGNVHWSVDIQAPIAPGVSVGTVITDRPYAPVVVAPAPVYLPAPPVYLPAPPPVYVPAPVVYPRPVYAPRAVYAPVWANGRWAYPHHHHRYGYPAPAPIYRPGREIRY
jgi:hypothetical protein